MSHALRSRFALIALVAALFFGTVSVAFASGYYNYSNYNYDSRNYDYSIDHSYNDYYSHNYVYNYPYYNSYDHSYRYYDYNYDYRYQPNCSITVRNVSGNYGYDRYVTLAWSSSYATSAYLSGVGSVGTNGAQAVYYPYQSTYTLTVYGPGGTATCSTNNPYYGSQSYYGNYDYAYNSYAHPLYTYANYTQPIYVTPTVVKLSQTPYTGFDYGPLGNSLYWLAMIVAAMCGAYLIVYFRGWNTRTLALEVVSAARNQVRFVKSLF